MLRGIRNAAFSIAFLALTCGCSGLLPSAKETRTPTWTSFEESKDAYDLVVPHETTVDDLRAIGFDPFASPNVRILTYLDIIERFMPTPSIVKSDLDSGVQSCIEERENCMAYETDISIIKSKRTGSFWLDFFNFKRHTERTGWEFRSLFIIVNGRVVFKLWNGRPLIDEATDTKNPLGPLQDADELLLEQAL